MRLQAITLHPFGRFANQSWDLAKPLVVIQRRRTTDVGVCSGMTGSMRAACPRDTLRRLVGGAGCGRACRTEGKRGVIDAAPPEP